MILFALLFIGVVWAALGRTTIIYNCPKCGGAVGDDNRYCTCCGSNLPNTKKCSACAKYYPESVSYCPRCGKPTLAKEELARF